MASNKVEADDIAAAFSEGVDDYWSGIIPDEYREFTPGQDRREVSPYLLGWLTAGDWDNGINYFSED